MDELSLKAKKIATKAHEGQYRWDKKTPYITHSQFVANGFIWGSFENIVAWLHDVVEDTDITLQDIYENFPSIIGHAINAITKRKIENYLDYILSVKKNKIATNVKIQDIKHNMQTVKGAKKDKYMLALYILEN